MRERSISSYKTALTESTVCSGIRCNRIHFLDNNNIIITLTVFCVITVYMTIAVMETET